MANVSKQEAVQVEPKNPIRFVCPSCGADIFTKRQQVKVVDGAEVTHKTFYICANGMCSKTFEKPALVPARII